MLLERHGLLALAIAAGAIATAGYVAIPGAAENAHLETVLRAPSPMRLRLERQWLIPLAVVVLSVPQWGAILAFLPTHASDAGAHVGIFFLADGVAIILSRSAAGLLIAAATSRTLVVAGLSASAVATLALLVPASDATLVFAGAASGVGAGLFVTPITVEIAHRSSRRTQGSAYALFAACHASGIVVGGIGGSLVGSWGGFASIMIVSGVCLAAAAATTFLDPLMGRKPDRISRIRAAQASGGSELV
jgi:predicted MFS family arabinose efflux permease